MGPVRAQRCPVRLHALRTAGKRIQRPPCSFLAPFGGEYARQAAARARACARADGQESGSPSRQKRASSLRKRNIGRNGKPADLKPVSASRAQSFYAPGSSHLGSLPLRHLHRLQVDQRAELGPFLPDGH
jgi:hypothetical protein